MGRVSTHVHARRLSLCVMLFKLDKLVKCSQFMNGHWFICAIVNCYHFTPPTSPPPWCLPLNYADNLKQHTNLSCNPDSAQHKHPLKLSTYPHSHSHFVCLLYCTADITSVQVYIWWNLQYFLTFKFFYTPWESTDMSQTGIAPFSPI